MKIKNYTSEFKNNLKLATPIMMGSLGHLLVGLIDDIMVGRLGPVELAATSLGNSLVFIALSIGIGFSFAITPLIAESDGEGDKTKARSIFQHGIILMTILGIALFLMLLVIKPILYHLDQPDEVVVLAIPYYEIVAISMIPLMIFQGLKQFTDGLSETKYAMYATILTNIVNVVLNFALIYGLWIFPRLEIVGAALGTLISRVVMVAFLYIVLMRKEKFAVYMKRLNLYEIKAKVFQKIIGLGFPTALQMLFEVGLFTASVLLAGTLGALSQAANQIALKLASTTFMIAVGIGVASTIRVGNQKGLKNYIELRRIAFSNFLLIVLIMFTFTIGFMLLKDILPWMFTDNLEVIKMASGLLIIAGLFQLSDGLQAVILGGLRGLQDVNIPSGLTFIAYWIIGFPICYYLGKENVLGTLGIWIGLLTALTSSALMLFFRFNYLSNKLIQEKNELT
ncbi:MAG: MATE family efflux transporter [Lutibacter sp.]|uniref:MATE family efflux transporter n=1 Tax=Lutibacter sp. TaxID=1925666 RepID=UPI001842B725|nr:MATE family efflux transporter [Lutibacter sp.]MBT8316159.1 MATE family efflux transporter [Lutibacter sp.]NNJ57019.1 MATE family efflux transporter [Lutibacter sp.]